MREQHTRSGPAGFSCSWSHGGLDASWVYARGELDVATTPLFEQTLNEARSRLVVLDLRQLTFLGSSGVHAIVGASVRARFAGRRVVVLRGAPHVDRILMLTSCADQVEIVDLGPEVSRDKVVAGRFGRGAGPL
jgi:anti-anti-sigma factor